MKANKILFVFLLTAFIISCNRNEMYFDYRPVSAGGWNKDSLLVYNVQVDDTLSTFNFYVHVRHYGNYSYQNLWLFVDYLDRQDSILKKDTIECYLADEYGKWMGSGAGAIKEIPVYLKKSVRFGNKGDFRIRIQQGMRDSVLRGINKVGVRIEKVE